MNLSTDICSFDLENEISYDPVANIFYGGNVNIDSTRRRGLLLNLILAPDDDLAIGLNGSVVNAEIKSGSLKGKDLPAVPEIQAGVYADYRYSEKLTLKAELLHVDERFLSGDYDNSLKKLPSYEVVNLSARYVEKNIEYKLRVNNAFNEEYSEVGQSGYDALFNVVETYYPSPERNVVGSITVKF